MLHGGGQLEGKTLYRRRRGGEAGMLGRGEDSGDKRRERRARGEGTRGRREAIKLWEFIYIPWYVDFSH